MRRSGRPKCPPVEFWNFERPDYSVSHDISYNISVLGNRSRKQGDSTLQAKTKEFSIVLKDVDKPKASQKGNYDEELKSTKGRRSSKQVETVTNIGNTSKRSFTRDQRKSILTEGKETSRGNEPLLPKNKKTEKNEVLKNDLKNQPTKGNIGNKERKNRDPRVEKGQNMTEASQIHLGESGYHDSQDLTEGLDDILSDLSRNNSYCRNRKPPNFKGVLSSTAVNEVDMSKLNSSNSSNVGRDRVFKVPRNFPKVLLKKHSRIEPTLDCIAEEKENEVLYSELTSTPYITPKKSSILVRSRLLNLKELEDEDNKEAETQSSRKQGKENRDEGKSFVGPSHNDPTLTNVTSQNLTTQSDFGSFRRSSRARIKRLEFWNFEQAHITTMNNGEVSVAYTKKEDPSESVTISKKMKDNSKCYPVTLPSGIKRNEKQKKPLPKKDTLITKDEKKSKRTNSSDEDQSLITPDASPRKRMKRQSLVVDDFLPSTEMVDFKSLKFHRWVEQDFICFVARSYCNQKTDLYGGFLFLQRGEMIWSTTMFTTFYVIEGEGTLTVLDSHDDDGILISLVENAKAVVSAGKKLRLEKEDSDEKLKLLIVMQNNPS
ncbi:uncharacterized protein [Palaemon carinicauda]|uniref:uncharacterized protein isoform X2 n=1 Tax=Palaemon carinicauda TaxID=392227 RepID=UPI0035B60E77